MINTATDRRISDKKQINTRNGNNLAKTTGQQKIRKPSDKKRGK